MTVHSFHKSAPNYGENAAYDRQQEHYSEIKRAKYANVAENHKNELRHAQVLKEIELKADELKKESAKLQRLRERCSKLIQAQGERVQQLKRQIQNYSSEEAHLSNTFALKARRGKDLREEARARGAKQYLTGYPCKNGHIDYRYVTSGACVACDAMYSRPGYTKRREKP